MVAFSDIIDFLLTLLSDETARAEFDKNPQAALGKAGLEGVTAQDIRDARLQLADSGAVHATDDGARSASPHGDDPVREIGHTTPHYAARASTTRGPGDLNTATRSSRSTTATRCSSSRSPTTTSRSTDDHSVNNQLTAIQDNDVNVSDDDTDDQRRGLVQLRQRPWSRSRTTTSTGATRRSTST